MADIEKSLTMYSEAVRGLAEARAESGRRAVQILEARPITVDWDRWIEQSLRSVEPIELRAFVRLEIRRLMGAEEFARHHKARVDGWWPWQYRNMVYTEMNRLQSGKPRE